MCTSLKVSLGDLWFVMFVRNLQVETSIQIFFQMDQEPANELDRLITQHDTEKVTC